MKKPNRPKVTKVKELADDIFSISIRLYWSIKTTGDRKRWRCVTCDLVVPSFRRDKAVRVLQLWHFVERGVLDLRYNPKNCHGQCSKCNNSQSSGNKGEQYLHWRAIDEMYWEWTADELMTYKHKASTMKVWDYVDVIRDQYISIWSIMTAVMREEIPESARVTIKKSYKLLDWINWTDEYRVEKIR